MTLYAVLIYSIIFYRWKSRICERNEIGDHWYRHRYNRSEAYTKRMQKSQVYKKSFYLEEGLLSRKNMQTAEGLLQRKRYWDRVYVGWKDIQMLRDRGNQVHYPQSVIAYVGINGEKNGFVSI